MDLELAIAAAAVHATSTSTNARTSSSVRSPPAAELAVDQCADLELGDRRRGPSSPTSASASVGVDQREDLEFRRDRRRGVLAGLVARQSGCSRLRVLYGSDIPLPNDAVITAKGGDARTATMRAAAAGRRHHRDGGADLTTGRDP